MRIDVYLHMPKDGTSPDMRGIDQLHVKMDALGAVLAAMSDVLAILNERGIQMALDMTRLNASVAAVETVVGSVETLITGIVEELRLCADQGGGQAAVDALADRLDASKTKAGESVIKGTEALKPRVTPPTPGSISASLSVVAQNPATVPADGSSASIITVSVKDEAGNPISGRTVLISSTLGTVTQPTALSTDASGQVAGSVVSTTAGVATVTAVVEEVTLESSAEVTFTLV